LAPPRAVRQRIGAGIDRDREGPGGGLRPAQRVAAVACADVYDHPAVRAGQCGDLTDVDVDQSFTSKHTHEADGSRATPQERGSGSRDEPSQESAEDARWSHATLWSARLSRGVDRLKRVRHQSLRPTERARHVETPVEAPEILGGLQRFFERGLGEAQCRAQPLELARVYIRHGQNDAPEA
jgi:hypothetical protein